MIYTAVDTAQDALLRTLRRVQDLAERPPSPSTADALIAALAVAQRDACRVGVEVARGEACAVAPVLPAGA